MWEILNFDKLRYAGNAESLADITSDHRYQFVGGDISDHEIVNEILSGIRFDALINFAAETHVDRNQGIRRCIELCSLHRSYR
jgi:dTDP-glucose 4,6-dehydratase